MVSLPPDAGLLAIAVRGAGMTEALLSDCLTELGFGTIQFVDSLAELRQAITRKVPRLVFVPIPDASQRQALQQCGEALRRNPDVLAIGTAANAESSTVLAALRAGVLEFLQTPCEPDALRAAVRRVLAYRAPVTPSGEVYTVYSAKGGLGGSTLALSLAWALRHRGEAQHARPATVAFVDFTTTGAGARVMLDLEPVYDLGSVASRSGVIDGDFIRSCMLQHPSGVHILVAAEQLDAADPLDGETAGRVLELLREAYEFVVVDVDHHFADQTLTALDAADRVVLVSQLDVSALRSAQRTLGVFNRLGYAADKVVLTVNRRTDRDRIAITDAEHVLGRSVDVSLPNDYAACADAITFGRFLQQHAPDSPLVPAMRQMVEHLSGTNTSAEADEQPSRDQGSRLSRLFARH
jgi:pilus assembly protein CpaE